MTIKTDLELLKKEVQDMKLIHTRLDTAIEKLTDVSSCVNRMLAVHEEKLARQEDDIVSNEKEIKAIRYEEIKQKVNNGEIPPRLRKINSKEQKWEKPIFKLGAEPFLLAEIFKVLLLGAMCKYLLRLKEII